MALADRGGIEALTMRQVAGALGVQAMSLYNHVANKDDIVDSLVDAVFAEMQLPPATRDWALFMNQRAKVMYAVLTQHPWATLTIVSRIAAGPARLQFMEQTLACLAAAGFALIDADHVTNAFDSFVYGFVLQELRMPLQPADYSAAAGRFLSGIDTGRYPHFTALSKLVISGDYDGINDLENGLRWLTAGLAAAR